MKKIVINLKKEEFKKRFRIKKQIYLFLFFILIAFSRNAEAQTCTTYTTSGSTNTAGNFTIPAGVTTMTVYCFGGGGGSGGCISNSSDQAAGGGGGGASAMSVITVSNGQVYTYTVGGGGTAGATTGTAGGTGGTSTFTGAGGTITANGGGGGGGASTAGAAGTAGTGAAAGIGGYAGGNGTVGVRTGTDEVGGAGGGGAGSGGAGGNGTSGAASSNTTGGSGGVGTYSGSVGTSGITTGGSSPGVAGNSVGGGAAGAASYTTVEPGAVGGAGQIVFCYCQSASITVAAAPATQTICQNTAPTNLSLTATGTGLTYQWYSNTLNLNTLGTSVGAGNGGQTNTFTPPTTSAGTTYYYCVVTGSCGAAATSAAVQVIVTASPVVAAIGGGAATVCLGSSTPAFTDATAGGTWSITNGTGSATNVGGVVTGVSNGGVTVNYAVTGGGCTTTVTTGLTVNSPVVAAIGGGAANVCVGSSTAAFTDATAGGTWSITNGTGSATNVGGVVTGVSAGSVTVKYSVTSAGCTTTVTYALTVLAVPVVAAIGGGAASVCVGSATAAFTDATAGGTWSITNGTGSATNVGGVVTGVTPGTATVNYAVTSGGCTTTVTTALTINGTVVAAIGGGAANVCVGSTTAAYTDATAGGVWSETDGTGSATISVGGIATGVSPGSVTINYAVTSGGCTNTVTKALTVKGTVVAAIGGGAANVCVGSSTTAFTDATGGGTWSTTSGTGSATNVGGVVTGSTAGSVTVNYSVVNGGCTNSVTTALTVLALPTVAAIGGGAANVCVGGTTAAFTDATAGGVWSVTNGTGSATISVGGVATGVSAGSVTINYVVTSGGCTNSATYALTVVVLPTVAAIGGGTVAVCPGGTTPAFTDATAGGVWSITNGTGTASISAGGVVTGGTNGTVTVNYAITNVCGTVTTSTTLTVGCAGNVNAGTAVATVVTGCVSYTTALSLSGASTCGVTYQWQSSPDNSTWSNIAGATSATCTATINSSTYFQCIVTCTTDGTNDIANLVYCQYVCNGGVAVSSGSACSGNYTASLALTGIVGCSPTYQWQSSPDGTTWSNIGGATAATAAPTVSANTYYQCLVTCASGVTSTATAVYCGYQAAGATNDNCSTPYTISSSNLNGTWLSGFSTSCATYDNSQACNTTSQPNNWFNFTAQGPNLEITVSGINKPIITLWSGTTCAALSYIGCFGGSGTSATAFNNGFTAGYDFTVTAGQTYYAMISQNSGTTGSYSIAVNSPTPNPSGTDCATSKILCSGGSFNGAASLWGTQELSNATNYGCNLHQEINSSWYVLNVLIGGTLTFTLNTTDGVDDYDYALYNSNDCNNLGAPLTCNYSSYPGITGINSSNCGGSCSNSTPAFSTYASTWNTTITLAAGAYLFYVNGFTSASEGYSFTFGGTAVLGCKLPVILPIALLKFSATLNNKQVDLNWTTASEIDNNYFTIERSQDGKNFEELIQVNGAGNSTGEKNYSTIDYAPLPGVSYYRLSQTDFNGKKNEITITSVKNTDNDGMFTVIPNPTTGLINVSYSCGNSTTGVLSIYDGSGVLQFSKEIVCTAGNNKTQLDLSNNISGIYLVTFSTDDKFYRTKLIKQ